MYNSYSNPLGIAVFYGMNQHFNCNPFVLRTQQLQTGEGKGSEQDVYIKQVMQ